MNMLLNFPEDGLEVLAQRVADILDERGRTKAAARGNDDELLTVKEAARLLKCKPQRIHDLTSAGKLPRVREGGRVLIRRGDIRRWLRYS